MKTPYSIKRLVFTAVLSFISIAVFGQETINTMFYNLLEYPSASPANRRLILQNILQDYSPDIFMVCELETNAGSTDILDFSLNGNVNSYSAAPFVENQSTDVALQQNLFYRSSKFGLIAQNIIITTVRDINHYVLRMQTEDMDTNPIDIHIFIAHLKSSQGNANEVLRLEMVTEFTDFLATLPQESNVIFAGDLNMYEADEDGYIELLDPSNTIVLKDPIDSPGDWNNNEIFSNIHTQSTRVSSGEFGAGAGGGLDDRFDFILLSENMISTPSLQYIPDTYKAYGNNGNCYNLDINDPTCTGEFSQTTRSRLYNTSDHLPVVLSLQTDQTFILSNPSNERQTSWFLESTLVSNEVRLSITSEIADNHSIIISNTFGQKVAEKVWDVHTNQQQIDVSMLPTGIYFINSKDTNLPTLQFLKR